MLICSQNILHISCMKAETVAVAQWLHVTVAMAQWLHVTVAMAQWTHKTVNMAQGCMKL